MFPEQELELEKKYFIIDKATYRRIMGDLYGDNFLVGFQRLDSVVKGRNYRAFDTWGEEGGELEKRAIALTVQIVGKVEDEGSSASLRERPQDYVLTVKRPTEKKDEREDHNHPIPPKTDFYRINPNHFSYWGPMRQLLEVCQWQPLQERVRYSVETHRFNFGKGDNVSLEIALDQVTANIGDLGMLVFYELEIERKSGTDEDVLTVASFFEDKYQDSLISDSSPKWIKALKLARKKMAGGD